MFRILCFFLIALPFLVVFTLGNFNVISVVQVTSSKYLYYWVTLLVLIIYYGLLINFSCHLKYRLAAYIVIITLSAVFLPVRKDISVVDYVIIEDRIYWIERTLIDGVIQIHSSDFGFLLKKKKMFEIDEVIHLTYFEKSTNNELSLITQKRQDSQIAKRRINLNK